MKRAKCLLRLGRPLRPIRRGGEPEARRQKNRSGRDVAGGLEVALDEHGRHGHRLPDVGEALAADGVGREFAGLGRSDVHTR